MKVRLGEVIEEYSVRNKDNQDIPVYSVKRLQVKIRLLIKLYQEGILHITPHVLMWVLWIGSISKTK